MRLHLAHPLNNALREYDVSRSDGRSIAFDVFGGAKRSTRAAGLRVASPPVQHVVAHCLGERSIPISLCSLVSHGHVSSCMTETPHQFLGRCAPPGGKSGRHPSQAVKSEAFKPDGGDSWPPNIGAEIGGG